MKKIFYAIFAFAGLFVFNDAASADTSWSCGYKVDVGGSTANVTFAYKDGTIEYSCGNGYRPLSSSITCNGQVLKLSSYLNQRVHDLYTDETCDLEGSFIAVDSNNQLVIKTDSSIWSCTYTVNMNGSNVPVTIKNKDGKTTLNCGSNSTDVNTTWFHCGDNTFILSSDAKTAIANMNGSCNLQNKEFAVKNNILNLDVKKTDTNADNTSKTYEKIKCGEVLVPRVVAKIVRTVVFIIQVATPIIIIIFGSIDLFKAVIAQKDDDIRKGREIFVKRLLTGALVFLAFFIVEMLISIVAPDDKQNSWNCVDCFINGNCDNLSAQ